MPGNYRNQKTDNEPGRPVFNDTDKIKDLQFPTCANMKKLNS